MLKIKTITFLLIGSFSFAQEFSEKTKIISSDACDCISKVNLDLSHEEKLDEIKSCISGAIMASQLAEKLSPMVDKALDTLNKIDDISKIDTLNVVDKQINIVLNDEENYVLRFKNTEKV